MSEVGSLGECRLISEEAVMAAPLSQDLRKRLVGEVEQGSTLARACAAKLYAMKIC